MSLKRNSLLAAELVTFSHTLFVLPLILSGYFVVYDELILMDIFLIIIAAVSARTIGMLLNRIVDYRIDLENPRTSSRPLPSGRVSKNFVYFFLALSIFIYLITCWSICDFVFMLSPIPVIFFIIYPYMKRFTPFCHFFLGIALSIGPIAGGVATSCDFTGLYSTIPIGIFTFFWISGFDILYALQDYEHDIKNNIFSIPSVYGISNGIKVSSLCFALSFIAILYYSYSSSFNLLNIIIILLILINYVFQIINSSNNNYSFFKYNSYIGILILILVISDILFI